jgi:hypothetical protein
MISQRLSGFLIMPVILARRVVYHPMPKQKKEVSTTFRRLHGCMPQQELNLLQLATARVAQLGTGSPQVMRGHVFQSRSLAAGLDYVPHNILRDAFPPHLSRPGDGSKDPSLRDPGCHRPLIERRLYPFWDGHGADVATLADQIHGCPATARSAPIPESAGWAYLFLLVPSS